MIDFAFVLGQKYAKCEWILDGESYSDLIWLSDTPKPSEKDLEDAYAIILDEIEKEKTSKEIAKAAAEAKLEALGLTTDDLKALGL
jgi:hypothetical protein